MSDQTLLQHIKSLAPSEEIVLCRPSVGELWFMVWNSSQVAKNRKHLEDLLDSMTVWEFDADAAREFGRIRTELRRQGRPIPQIDVQIAAIARINDATLLTADRHFADVSGLRIQNWRSLA